VSAQFLAGPGIISPPLDGKTPVFEEVGAVPGAAYIRPPGSIAKFGSDYYWQAGTLAAPVWILFDSSADAGGAPDTGLALAAAGAGLEALLTARAAAALGVDPTDMALWLYPCAAAGLIGAGLIIGGGAFVAEGQRNALSSLAAAGGGVVADVQNSTGAAIGGLQLLAAGNWYLAARYAHNAAGPVGAGVKSGFGGRTATTAVSTTRFFVGIDGSVNVNNFSCSGDAGAAMDSGVAIDAADHEHEVAFVGGVTRYWIDRTLRATGNAAPAANSAATRMAFNSAAVLAKASFAWIAVAVPLAATP
jgi:hypothetical protein